MLPLKVAEPCYKKRQYLSQLKSSQSRHLDSNDGGKLKSTMTMLLLGA